LGRFWQSEIAAASSVYAFIDGQRVFVGFSQQAGEFSPEVARRAVALACSSTRPLRSALIGQSALPAKGGDEVQLLHI